MKNARKSTRRRWIRWLILALIVAAVGFAALAVLQGGKPLVDGTRLAGGKIVLVADGHIGAYVVKLDAGVALIDATMDRDANAIRTTLDELGIGPDEVRAILITHGHGDHIAGALAFPDAEVYALSADADLVEGRRVAGNLLGRFREPAPTGITVDHALNDGQTHQIGGTTFEVFAVPGHTRGSAAYLVHGVLFLGDAAGASSRDTIVAAPPVFSWDRQLAAESLHELARRLEARADDVDTLAFGHQGPLNGVQPLIEWHENNR